MPRIKRFVTEYFRGNRTQVTTSGIFHIVHTSPYTVQLSRKDITETPLFKICEDMDARLAINQGYTRPGDYRDALQSIIEQKFPSRYAFCQTVGLDEGYLSRVLNKRQHISMKKLAYILDALGYEVTIREKTDHPGATAPDTKREAITHVGDVP